MHIHIKNTYMVVHCAFYICVCINYIYIYRYTYTYTYTYTDTYTYTYTDTDTYTYNRTNKYKQVEICKCLLIPARAILELGFLEGMTGTVCRGSGFSKSSAFSETAASKPQAVLRVLDLKSCSLHRACVVSPKGLIGLPNVQGP